MISLEESIERLYAAFADVPKPSRIKGCPCCIADKKIDKILSSRLREIAPEDLSSYAASALLTVGDVSDYLHFLPRILEITATEFSWWPFPEVTGSAILAAKVGAWPASRRDALASYLGAVIEAVVERGTHYKLDDWMCAIDRMGRDVRPYLDRIAKSPEAVLSYFEDNARCLPKSRLCNPFWELPCEGHDVIVDWFYSDAIRKVPLDAYGFVMPPRHAE